MNGKTIIAGLCCLAVGAGAGCLGASAKYSEEIGFCSEYSEFFGAYKDVKESYYKDISTLNKNRIEEEMLKGFVNGFDDRFSKYKTKEDTTVTYVNGAPSTISSGFTIERDRKTKMIRVVTVEKDSQAEKMGLKVGDLITAVGGTDVTPDNFPETAEKLLGKDGTTVELKIKSGSEEKTISFERRNDGGKTAEKIHTKIFGDNIGYLDFEKFNMTMTNGVGYFTEAMDELQKGHELKGLIIDLRKNHGGAATEPIQIFDLFADSGSKTWDEDKNGNVISEMFTSDGVEYDMPVVVLVSGDTYSSAEKLTAFFQSTKRGTVVGTQTGGKGVYQDNVYLSDGTAVTLVQGYYYVNDVPNFNGVGLTPDIVIDMDTELIGTDKDIQLKKAIELLS